MQPNKTTITRVELYEKVWTTPLRTLAKEFGLSDVGLAKVCRRHNIPRPGLGYWACIQAGQKLKRSALPAVSDPRLNTIEIWAHEPSPTQNAKAEEKIPAPIIPVSEERQIAHPVVARIEKSLSQSKKDERGILLARLNRLVPVSLSAGTLPRALRILDVLFSSIEERGCSVQWPSPYNTRLEIITDSEKLQLSVTEKVERKKHEATAEETARKGRDYWWNPPRWDYILTGRLSLTMGSVEFPGVCNSWSDGKRQKLENCVGEIVVAFQNGGSSVKLARKAHADAEQRRIKEQKLQYLASIRRSDYERKADAVKRLAQAWSESNLLIDFAKALQAKAVTPSLPDDVRQELENMIDWTVRRAIYLNPISHVNWMIKQFNGSSWF